MPVTGVLSRFVRRVWNSPTLMTYGSFFTRSLSLVVVLPFLLTRLSTEEIYLWYLFLSIAGFQLLVDMGFSPTFSRVIAYAMAGEDLQSLKSPKGGANGSPNWKTLESIWSTMRFVYVRLGTAWFLLLLCIGTLAVSGPVTVMNDATSAWISWCVVLVVSFVTFRGIVYSAYLQGVNKIAVLRRWEIITAVGSAISSVLVLVWLEDLLALVLVSYGWGLLNVARNRWLAGRVHERRLSGFMESGKNEAVMQAVWSSTWRTGVGVLMSYGIVQSSGVIYAQVATPAEAATYFLTLRMIQVVSQFSQAPFYSKLPKLASMYSVGSYSELVAFAKKGMQLSYLSFVIGFVLLGIIGDRLLPYIGSNAEFPGTVLWGLFGIAYFFERYGAMHINLYSTTNNIINHVANGVSGIVYIFTGAVLYGYIGILAFPAALIAGNAGFYAWYAARHSYRAFGLEFLSFELTAMIPFLAVLLLYVLTGLFF